MDTQAFVFLGRSGSGKGTQAKMLQKYLEDNGRNVLYLETGRVLRELASKDTPPGREIKNILDRGAFAPPFLPVWLWTDFLFKNFTGKEFIILDGVCRRKDEAVLLASIFDFLHVKKSNIIFLDVSEEWSLEKMMNRKRADDTEEQIKSRLAWYEKEALPSIEYFRNLPAVHFLEINGEQSIEKVHQDILGALGL